MASNTGSRLLSWDKRNMEVVVDGAERIKLDQNSLHYLPRL